MSCVIKESLLDCNNLPTGGQEKFVELYPFLDWVAIKNAGNVTREPDGSVSNIINNTGLKAFRFDVPDSTALVLTYPDRKVDGGIDGYDHMVNFSIINMEQEQKNTISAMRFENVVAIVFGKNGRGQIFGEEQGLQILTNNGSPNNPSLGAVIPIELKTSDREAAESQPPLDIFDTDAATTKSLIDGLLIAGA
jgi:hypothetical protein